MSLRAFNQLPKEVVVFLSNPDAPAQAERFLRDHGGKTEAADVVLNAVEDVVLQAIELDRFPDALKETGIPNEKLQSAAADAAAKWLLPIAGVVGDVKGAIIGWGGSLDDTKGVPTVAGELTPEGFAQAVLSESGVRVADPMMQNRLRLILVSFVKGVRVRSDALAVLTRAKKVGGAELSAEDAQALLAATEAKLEIVKVAFEEEAAPAQTPPSPPFVRGGIAKVAVRVEKPVAQAPKAPEAQTPPSLPLVRGGTGLASPLLMKEGQGEVVLVKPVSVPVTRPKPVTPAKPAAPKPLTETDRLVAAIVDAAKLTLKSEEERSRFARIVESRVRDVRDAYEMRAQLELAPEQGGLGLSGARLAEASEAVERVIGDYQRKIATQATQEKEKAMTQKREVQEARASEENRLQEVELAKRYSALTGRVPAETQAQTPPSPPFVRGGSAHPNLVRQEGQVDVQKMKAAALRPVQGVPPAMSAASIPASEGRPQVQDVRFRQRLSGPLEELKNLTLTDMRRLSSDPTQAAMKIKAKFALLEEQGYDRRIAALEAWKASPVNRAYLTLTREAIVSGKPMAALAKEMAKDSQSALTEGEIAALRALNAELRF